VHIHGDNTDILRRKEGKRGKDKNDKEEQPKRPFSKTPARSGRDGTRGRRPFNQNTIHDFNFTIKKNLFIGFLCEIAKKGLYFFK
jgi:hypothetical protein